MKNTSVRNNQRSEQWPLHIDADEFTTAREMTSRSESTRLAKRTVSAVPTTHSIESDRRLRRSSTVTTLHHGSLKRTENYDVFGTNTPINVRSFNFTSMMAIETTKVIVLQFLKTITCLYANNLL